MRPEADVGRIRAVEEEVDLDAALVDERDAVEEALQRAVADLQRTLPEAVAPVVRYGVLSGGKRIRPILCVAAYRACGGSRPEIHDLAVSLELIHAYSLMHDDLPCMDDADLRRGRQTPHRRYGEAATMAAAAALIPAAARQAWRAAVELQLDPERARATVRVLLRAAGASGMVGGQALDLLAEGRTLSPDELDEVHRRKTGALLAAAPRMGALAAGAPEPVEAALGRYGRDVGLAFQIADDILDATADPADLGKEPSDRDLEKSTYVSLHGLDEARRRARAEADRARSALDDAGVDHPLLHALAEFAVRRRT